MVGYGSMMMGDIWKQSGTISACIVDTGSTAKNGFDLLGNFPTPISQT